MESLLAHSFDYLSSYEPSKIRKGLRQVEGLLAQICLSKPKSSATDKRRPLMAFVTPQRSPLPTPKPLSELKDDPAFREFFKLQEGFQWNVAMRLVICLEHLLGGGNNGTNELLMVSTLDLIQGVLLLHPPSRTLFAREIYMNLLLDLLDPINSSAVQSATLLTLVTALLDNPANTRAFEDLDGLLTVTSLFKLRTTSRDVKLKLVEFLYFYLMPETPISPTASAPNTAVHGLQCNPAKLSAVQSPRSVNVHGTGGVDRDPDTRTTDEKQALLGRYLNNVDGLVEDLKETAPFGATVY